MIYKIDVKKIIDGEINVKGWVITKSNDSNFECVVFDKNKKEVPLRVTHVKRDDVAEIYLTNKNLENNSNANDFGFDATFSFNDIEKEEWTFVIRDKGSKEQIKETLNKKKIDNFNTNAYKKKEQILAYLNMNTFKRGFEFLTNFGLIEFVKKAKRKIKGIQVDYDYDEWYNLTRPTDEEFEKQRQETFPIRPFFSVVIPVYDTDTNYLSMLFESLMSQTYDNFEIIVADATDYSKNKNNPRKFFNDLINKKIKISYYNYDINNIHIIEVENKSIAENTNRAIEKAKGDYIVLVDHDDCLTSDALYENVVAINNNKNLLFIYSDEDKVDTKNQNFFEPNFKSDFNLDMLLSVNYICHLAVIKKDILDTIKNEDGSYERSEYDGAQDYDLFLRIVNRIINTTYDDKTNTYDTSSIYHIRKVLYHWRCHNLSTAKNVDSKNYAFINGAKAINNFYQNTKINFDKVENVEKGFDYGIYKTVYADLVEEPLVSVIIPNKDHKDDLNTAITSIMDGEYKNLQIIVCENNSTEKDTFAYYDDITKKYGNVEVVHYEGNFNYSKINNFASKYAKGEYLLFLNNDVEMINNNSITRMVHHIRRNDVGAVGAKLLYKDNTIQHAGVVIGFGGIAGHTFIGVHDKDSSYQNRSQLTQDYNAVTAACLMTKRDLFIKINGFDEDIAVAFNDIDLCVRIRNEKKLIVYDPYVSFYHYESKSRGLEDTKEKVERFNREYAFFVKKWNHILEKTDEYYNPNLTLRKSDFSLRNLRYEKIGERFPIPKEIIEIMKQI